MSVSQKINDKTEVECAWIGYCGHFKELWHSLEKKDRNGEATVSKFYVVLVQNDPTMQGNLLYIDFFVLFFQKHMPLFSACLVFHCGTLVLWYLFCLVLAPELKELISLLEVVGRNSLQVTWLSFLSFTVFFSATHKQSAGSNGLETQLGSLRGISSSDHDLEGPGSLESTALLESICWFDP